MTYDYKAKQKNVRQLNQYMLAKTLSMFEYEGLPDTLPARELEKLLQTKGYAFITKVNGELYALHGGMGGECDAYGTPITITIANPYLKYNATLDIEKDGVLVRSDDMLMGLLPYFEKQNTLLVESDINMIVWGYNSRNQKLISAPDDKTKESAILYMKKIIDGELSVIGENALFDGIKLQSNNGGSNITITQMIEFNQYLKASMYNEVGLSANFNMKRERLISSELDAAEDSLFPLVYNMMKNRLAAVAKINEMFGTDIKVGFGSVWALKNKELVDGVVDNGQLPDVTNTGNGNGSEGKAAESDTETDLNLNTNKEGNNNESAIETDTNSGSESDSSNSGGGDDESSREQETGAGAGEETKQSATELEAVINDPAASDDDKQAAQELLDELNKEEN